jgi:hypothetical protein
VAASKETDTMAKLKYYTVELEESVIYSVDVEAQDEDEAGELAKAVWAASGDPTEAFAGTGMGVEVIGVTDVGV